ncbi:MAG TPA: cell wall-binding repeat-containing protein [Solirubrobacteraceae bacterium]|jgi:hypothetical protein|nr:cell wall-binding repeat-containing protein [Solirubrobacteraceae bacterium]
MPSSTFCHRVLPLLLGAALLAGCGKSLPYAGQSHVAPVSTVAGASQLAANGVATKNTTRLGGADPVADAAAVALVTYPGLTTATRPQTVVVVNDRDWTAALAAAALAGAPLRAPLLYSEGGSLPALSAQALGALKPTGAPRLGGVQVIAIGGAAIPAGYRTLTLAAAGGEAGGGEAGEAGGGAAGVERGTAQGPARSSNTGSSVLAARVEGLVARLRGEPPRHVIVIGADGPAALAMPAAGLAAESGAPILPVDAAGIPPATRRVLARLHRPAIYAIGPPAAVTHAVLAELGRLGAAHRIYASPGVTGAEGPGSSGEDPADNAIAVARFAEGAFGWGIDQPGHGLVFANAVRPLDAPAAAPLAANGDYAPLLLLERPNQVPPALSGYLSDIRPGYSETPESEYQPVRGAYNHGWLIGDASAITPTVQAELDAMLEISPQSSTEPADSEATGGGEPG